MLKVPNSGDLNGVDICFLLDITWENQTYHFSTFDIVIYDGAIPYHYHGSLSEIELNQTLGNEFDVEGEAIPIEVIFIDKDLVLERLQGRVLDFADVKLYYVTVYEGEVLQSYNDRIPIARGKVTEPIFGEIDRPAGAVAFSIENGLNVQTTPLLTGKDILTAGQGLGKFRPIIIGRPCGYIAKEDGTIIESVASSPAYWYPSPVGENIIHIAAHPVEAESVTVVDQDGTERSKLVYNQQNHAYVGTFGLAVGDWSDTKITIKWDTGGGLKNPSTGDSINGAGDLLRYMLQLTGYPIDGDAIEGVTGYLNTWRLDGYINEDIDALEFIDNNIAGFFPVYFHNGPRGIRPILDLYNAVTRQKSIVTIEDGPDFRIVSGIVPMGDISDLCNNLILRCGYSEEKQSYTMNIEIDPRVELYNTTAMRFSTIYADTSYNRYGLQTKIIEHDMIGDFVTACSIAKDYIRRHAFLPIKVVVEANVSWGWLDLGDIVAINSDRLHMTQYKGQIIAKSWQGTAWRYDIRIDDSSLVNLRPIDAAPPAVTITPEASDGSFDDTNWYYIAGNSQTANDPAYKPRAPFAAVDGISDPIFTFWNGGSGYEMFSYKTAITGSVTVKFKLIRGGGGSSQPTYNVKLANNFASQIFQTSTFDWVTNKAVLIRRSSTGYTKTDTWVTQRTITKSDINWTGWFEIEETFTCSGEFVSIMSNSSGYSGGWAIVDVEFII